MGLAVFFDEYGDSSVLAARDVTLPPPGDGEVRIANRAIAVNPADWKIVSGAARNFITLSFPAIPGNENAGVVEAVGAGVEGISVGDAVIRVGLGNAYCAEGNYPAQQVFPMPAGLDFEQATSLTVAAGSAYSGLQQIGLQAGDRLLVHGVAGGVGIAVTQIARHLGATVIGTASPRNHEFATELGATPIAYGPGLVDAVRALGGVDAVFDAHGGAENVAATVELLPDLSRAATVAADEHSMAAGIAPVASAGEQMGAVITAIADLAVRGVLRFPIQERIPLAEAARAFDISHAGHVRGKLILVP